MGREVLEGLRVSPKLAASRKINKGIISHPVTFNNLQQLDVGFLKYSDLMQYHNAFCFCHSWKGRSSHLVGAQIRRAVAAIMGGRTLEWYGFQSRLRP